MLYFRKQFIWSQEDYIISSISFSFSLSEKLKFKVNKFGRAGSGRVWKSIKWLKLWVKPRGLEVWGCIEWEYLRKVEVPWFCYRSTVHPSVNVLSYIPPLIILNLRVCLVLCCVSDSVQKIPKWNFWKFLVNPEGKVVRFWRTDEPMESVRQAVTSLVREIILKKRVELWWWSSTDAGLVCVCDAGVSRALTAEEGLNSELKSTNVERVFVCVRGDHPVVNSDSHDEHSW